MITHKNVCDSKLKEKANMVLAYFDALFSDKNAVKGKVTVSLRHVIDLILIYGGKG